MFGLPNAHPLSKAVETLARPHPHTSGAGDEEALLVTLARAVASTSGKGSAAGVSRTGAPLDLGALVILDRVTAVIHDAVPGTRGLPLPERLIRWCQAVAGDPEEEEFLLTNCLDWEESIRRMLEPPKEIPLREVYCPECKVAHVIEIDPDGEHVYRPVMTAYASESPLRVECVLCGQEWFGFDVEALAS